MTPQQVLLNFLTARDNLSDAEKQLQKLRTKMDDAFRDMSRMLERQAFPTDDFFNCRFEEGQNFVKIGEVIIEVEFDQEEGKIDAIHVPDLIDLS
jgi:hypothetical protein